MTTLCFGSLFCSLGYQSSDVVFQRQHRWGCRVATWKVSRKKIVLLQRKELLHMLSMHSNGCSEENENVFLKEKQLTNSHHTKPCRSVKLKLLWRDPEFRARNLAGRRAGHVLLKQSIVVRERWKNPEFRKKVCDSLKGRVAWNKGKRMSAETRIRMSIAAKKRHGLKKGKHESRLPDVFFVEKQQNCELCQVLLQRLECLYKDLKLWSDNFRSSYTRLPRMNDVERSCAPVLLMKINRYIELKNILKSKPYCMTFANMVILKEDLEKEYKQILLDNKEIR